MLREQILVEKRGGPTFSYFSVSYRLVGRDVFVGL